ncbi:Lipase 3 [Orchesella cincta]|uniref:Lipase n=1 Tax=Orchesella cincta TaxID=48709 RepID=A0A1D2N8Q1_ORCCI|nr:Lipase 3 [Orchesella cincta]
MSPGALCSKQGYPFETHYVQTEDGYILEMHRIPHGKYSSARNVSKYPVIVQHGNFQSSTDWLVNSPESESLGFFLASHGYDVWLGNQRGNEFSIRHSRVPVSSSKFWNFSFHEMGMYDLPAMLDYVTKITQKPKAHYIGFSMGTTLFFSGLSKRPEYSDKIGIGIAMGPSTFQKYFFNSWAKVIAPFTWFIQVFQKLAGDMPVLPQFVANLLHKILPIICNPKVDLIGICMSVVQIGFGHDQGKITKNIRFSSKTTNKNCRVEMTFSVLKEILYQITKVSPSSSSMKAFLHELQLMGTNRFCEYDYGSAENMVVYGREHPPDYNLTNIRAPISLIVGRNDFMAHKEDAKTLGSKLPNLVDFHYVPYEHFTHLDFCYASDVSSLVYKHVVALLNAHDNT